MNTNYFEIKSKTIFGANKIYCKYCAKEIVDTGRYQGYDYCEEYQCDCETAKLEKQLNDDLLKLKLKISDLQYKEIAPEIIEKLQLTSDLEYINKRLEQLNITSKRSR